MSDFDKPSTRWGQKEGTPQAIVRNWWNRISKSSWLQSLRTWKSRAQVGPSPGPGRRPLRLPGRAGMWMLLVWVVLLCLPVAGIVLGYIRRPAAGTSGISTGPSAFDSGTDAGKKPKPSAGRPMLPVSQAPPPAVTSPSASAPIEPVAPPTITAPARPAGPTGAPLPPPSTAPLPPAPSASGTAFAPVTYPARHDKHFGDQCDGQLTLNSSGLYFSCPGNSGEGVDVAVNQIDAVDDNGVRLFSGKKYHFTISGMSRTSERQLFADWLSRVR